VRFCFWFSSSHETKSEVLFLLFFLNKPNFMGFLLVQLVMGFFVGTGVRENEEVLIKAEIISLLRPLCFF
jgi:hypothetical protein